MGLFLISSSIITLLAIFHNRYGTTSINSRLLLSSIATFCWVFPVSLLRNLIPTEMAEAIELRIPESITILSSSSIETTTANYSLGLIDGFIFLSLIGILSAVTRIYRHQKWVQSLDLDDGKTPKLIYQGLPVFVSEQVKNALLVGYFKPFIVVNSKLVDSKYIDIILEHERTHALNKDNFSLMVIEFIRSIYWWNPLIHMLAKDLCELLEARCDRKTSHSFQPDTYLQKLTSLMLLNRVDSQVSFNSTVVSKNPDVRRIKYLEDNPTMKAFSKINFTLLLVLIFAVLLIPISSIKTLARDISSSETKNKQFSMDFQTLPIVMASKYIGEFYEVTDVAIEPELKGVIFTNFKVKNINLVELSKLTNITWKVVDNSLQVSSMTSDPILKIMNDEDFNDKNGLVKDNDNEIGVLLKLELEKNNHSSLEKNTKSKKVSVWSHFGVPFSIEFDEQEIVFELKDNGENVLISSKIYDHGSDSPKKLIANPRIFTRYGNQAMIQIGDDSKMWTLRVDPIKTKNKGIEF